MKPTKSALPRVTDRLKVGEFSVSPFCMGMTEDPDTVTAAFHAGINFFFLTADMHWPYYETLRVGLKRLRESGVARDDIVLAVVSYPTQPEFCRQPFVEVIESFPFLERIDICVMGGSYAHDFMPRLRAFERHKRARLCGATAIGVTFHDRQAAVVAVNHELVDIAFIRYNPGHFGADHDVFPLLDPGRTVPIFGFKSTSSLVSKPERYTALGVGDGNWRPAAGDHYRYALSSHLDGILCGLTAPEQVKQLAEAMERGPLMPDEMAYMEDLAELVHGRAVVA